MGNKIGCFYQHGRSQRITEPFVEPPFITVSASQKTGRVSTSSSKKISVDDDALLRQQAVAAAMLFRQHQQNGSLPQFDRSTSVQYPLAPPKKQKKFPRSSSTRPFSLTDSPHNQLTDQDQKIDGLETKRFVLVHGGGFGAWCWYKIISLLKESGFQVDAVDLTGSGIHSCDTNTITSLAQYVKPLVDFLQKLPDGEKVILVGHDIGGACMSYVMELFPSKVSKAIFVAAAMLTSGQSTLHTFSQQMSSNDLLRQAQVFLYANGKDRSPTAIDIDRTLMGDLLFNQTPSKDVELASVSMRPIPFAPITEKLSLSKENYGSIRRFYIKTQEDFSIPVSLQEDMITANPPEEVFQIKGSDHSPFLSRPQALHKLLVEISKIPPKQI